MNQAKEKSELYLTSAERLRDMRNISCSGFTLLEMVITIAVIMLVAVAGFSFASRSRPNSQAAGERILSDLQRIVQTRHSQARELNTKTRIGGTSLEQGVTLFDIRIDFSQADSTRSLALDGVDQNADGRDDYTRQDVSIWSGTSFNPKYTGAPLQLPHGWRIALTESEMGGIPLIAGGQNYRGRPARCVQFSASGSIYPTEQNPTTLDCNQVDTLSVTSTRSDYLAPDRSPFLAVYAVFKPDGRSVAQAAVALAIYQSGYTELFRWDGQAWTGYSGRRISTS